MSGCWISLAIAVALAGISQAVGAERGAGSGPAPRVFLMDGDDLVAVREAVRRGDEAFEPAMQRLRREADRALESEPLTIIDKTVLAASGDKRDYASFGPYWWPNPETEDGLPYVRRDGQFNRELDSRDRDTLNEMSRTVHTLALAWFLTGHEPYAAHAAELLQVFFLDEQTRMNPHMQYAQAIPGHNNGRSIGLIDGRPFIPLVDAIGLLQQVDAWTAEMDAGMSGWLTEFLDWLIQSDHGKEQAARTNNLGTWYDAMVVPIALSLDREQDARDALERMPLRLAQVTAEGQQPHELRRTQSMSYSLMNLQALCYLARFGEHLDLDLWNQEADQGGSIRKAVDFLVPYFITEQQWQWEQVAPVRDRNKMQVLRLAARGFDDPRYEANIAAIGDDPTLVLHLHHPPLAADAE